MSGIKLPGDCGCCVVPWNVVKWGTNNQKYWCADTGAYANDVFGRGIAYGVAVDSQGNVIAADGRSENGALTKFDPTGKMVLWQLPFTSISYQYGWHGDGLMCVTVDESDNIYAAGSALTLGPTFDQYHINTVWKFDPNGNLIWQANWNNLLYWTWGSYSECIRIVVDSNHNVYVGTMTSSSVGSTPLFKLDANGNALWVSAASFYPSTGVMGLGVDCQGHIITGTTRYSTQYPANILQRVNSADGSVMWGKDLGLTAQIQNLVTTADGYTYAVGFCGTSTGYVGYVWKLDIDGNIIWTFPYNPMDLYPNRPSIVNVNPVDGNIYAANYILNPTTGANIGTWNSQGGIACQVMDNQGNRYVSSGTAIY